MNIKKTGIALAAIAIIVILTGILISTFIINFELDGTASVDTNGGSAPLIDDNQDNNGYTEGSILSVDEVRLNLLKYSGKNITVKGYVRDILGNYELIVIIDKNGSKSLTVKPPDDVNTSIFEPLNPNGYLWTGILYVEEGEFIEHTLWASDIQLI